MRVMDAKAAAEEIHGVVEGRLHPTAEDRHIQGFVTEVCNALGLEPSAINVAIVADALREADIQPHQVKTYPKMAVDENGKAILLDPAGKRLPVDARGFSTVEGVDGRHVIFENEEEEKAFGARVGKSISDKAEADAKAKKDAEDLARKNQTKVPA